MNNNHNNALFFSTKKNVLKTVSSFFQISHTQKTCLRSLFLAVFNLKGEHYNGFIFSIWTLVVNTIVV